MVEGWIHLDHLGKQDGKGAELGGEAAEFGFRSVALEELQEQG